MKLWQTYTLGSKTYFRYEDDNGVLLPEVGGNKWTEKEALKAVTAIQAMPEPEPVMAVSLSEVSDDSLRKEVELRKLNLIVKGEVTYDL